MKAFPIFKEKTKENNNRLVKHNKRKRPTVDYCFLFFSYLKMVFLYLLDGSRNLFIFLLFTFIFIILNSLKRINKNKM